MAKKNDTVQSEDTVIGNCENVIESGENAAAEAEEIIARARAEAEAIIAEAKKAAKKEKPPAVPSGEELVEYTAPLMPWMNSHDVFAAVNGETVRFKRGVPVKIKRKFLEVLRNAEAQEMKAYEYRTTARDQGAKAAANM